MFDVFRWGAADYVAEGGGEVRRRGEAGGVSNLRYGLFAFQQQPAGFVEAHGLDEFQRGYAEEGLHPQV